MKSLLDKTGILSESVIIYRTLNRLFAIAIFKPEYRKNSLLKYKLKLNFSKLKEIEKFESEIRQLEKNPKKLLDAWREYIQHELKLNDPGMLAKEIYRGGVIRIIR